ncbi:MAG TPA: hypothetical protein VLV32_04320 [Burkholderiales bacterium]|nr:hypothetical protein [Burkholderiales bacterium]
MEEHVIIESSSSAIINTPLDQIDIPPWFFSLPDDEYQGCSPAHSAAGPTTARDGRRMSINVEVIGGTPISSLRTGFALWRNEPKTATTSASLRDFGSLFTPLWTNTDRAKVGL